MADWFDRLDAFAGELEKGVRNAARAVRATIGAEEPIEILCYRGYANADRGQVHGRVKRGRSLAPSEATDTSLTNLRNTYRRVDADPVPFADVAVRWAGGSAMMKADDEGFFSGVVEAAPAPGDEEWRSYDVELIAPNVALGSPARATGDMLVPPPSSRLAVISDIDDTVIQSRVSNFLLAARTVLLGNARTRLPFPGVAAFYRALHAGVGGAERNPIFYVSSSPWNIHDVIAEFMELQRIPRGPILLRDWDVGFGALAAGRHFDHKGAGIRGIMKAYPHLPFILIGDTSQHDPEIYHAIVREFPAQVRAIYIRDVTRTAERSAAVQTLADDVRASGCALILSEDTLGAARHAAAQGWIDAAALPEVERECLKGVSGES